jgi:outer membrane protein assembly factor BamB
MKVSALRPSPHLLLTLAIAALAQSLGAQDWLQFRGPGGQGISTAKGLPESWSDTENIVWKTALPGAGASSPIAIGERLYLTCYSGYGRGIADPGSIDDLRLHVVCVDGEGGEIVWDRELEPELPESLRVRDHGYAAPTPVSDGKHLYCFFGKSGVFKFDLQGKPLWRASVGTKTHGWGCGTSPVLHRGLVIVNASVESGCLVALSQKSGKEVWRAQGMVRSWNTPHIVETPKGRHELAVSVKGFVLGFDPATGKELWRCASTNDYICPSIVSQAGILYAIGGRQSQAVAIRSGGRGDVTESHKLWHVEVGANVSSPVIHDGHLYWVSDRNRTAYCLSLEDGKVQYAERVRGQPYASTLLADGRMYVVTRSSGTLVLAARPEYELLAHNHLGDESTFNASPIVHAGRLILRSDTHLYCIDE